MLCFFGSETGYGALMIHAATLSASKIQPIPIWGAPEKLAYLALGDSLAAAHTQ